MIKPILFNTDMVRAILDGRKTATRRLIKPQPKFRLCYTFAGCNHGTWSYPSDTVYEYWGEECRLPDCITDEDKKMVWKPPYNADDILYVRETWSPVFVVPRRYLYKVGCKEAENLPIKWHPSIHMPKEAARIWLKVKDVRVERIKDMTDKDALNEGAQGVKCDHAGLGPYGCTDCMNTGWLEPPILEFIGIWDSTIKKSDIDRYGWDANPWAWVIEFERCEKPED